MNDTQVSAGTTAYGKKGNNKKRRDEPDERFDLSKTPDYLSAPRSLATPPRPSWVQHLNLPSPMPTHRRAQASDRDTDRKRTIHAHRQIERVRLSPRSLSSSFAAGFRYPD